MLGDGGRIDHHADCGFVSASPAMNYMELYPFVNRLWCAAYSLYDTVACMHMQRRAAYDVHRVT